MRTIINRTHQVKLYGAALAVAALILGSLTFAMSVGAQAELPGGGTSAYADPQPCGPGANTAFMPEPHEITSGHFYLFDAYWEDTTAQQSTNGNTGVLHTNTCPPKLGKVTKIDDFGSEETVIAVTDSGIDVDEAIFHVLDRHKVDVVATNAEATAGQLSLEEYPDVRTGLGLRANDPVPAGTQVWWLRLDDPDTTATNEKSDLTLGFSTSRFGDEHWGGARDGGLPFRYKFEFQRNPGIPPQKHPAFLAYPAPKAGNGEADPVWDTIVADTGDMAMEPGLNRDLQWVFTRPGTYRISSHLQGWVRQDARDEDGSDWERISPWETETSEVKRYLIQVGDPLDEEEPPVFGVNLSVPENSAAGTALGNPIPVYRTESTTLEYTLSGEGSDQFTTEALTEPHRVQIKVADGADLDFETRPAYDLTLGVSNKMDHEGNADDVIDDALAVAIELTDENEVLVSAANYSLPFGEESSWTASVQSLPDGATNVAYQWSVYADDRLSTPLPSWQNAAETGARLTWTVTENTNHPGFSVYVKVRVSATYTDGNGNNHSLPPVESDWTEWRR